ncbi:MAG: glycosyltransferase family 4 protein [Weeksellaceae bacterium]|nr:glycosyltransferase family 4 protein [Weeksellaceae bacterium]
MKKLFRISTVPTSLNILLKGQLKYLNQYFEVTAISGAGRDLEELAEREGVKTYAIEMQRQISPAKDLITLLQLYNYFRKEKPDIIHSITPKAGLLSMMAGKLAGVPVRIHTFTGLVFPYKKAPMQKLLIAMDRLLCWCATNIYPEGQGVKKDLEKYNITKKPLKIIGNGNVNGIDVEYFDPAKFSETQKLEFKKTLNIAAGDYIFLFVGRLVRDKGINELVEAFVKLHSEFPTAQLLLVGPFEDHLDPLSPETKSTIESHPHILSVGFQEDVRPFLAIADIFVFPSHREGFPNVLLQAGAMGLFSIVTDISGSNEIVTDGINGKIIPVNDTKELGAAIQDALMKKEDLATVKNTCRMSITNRFEQSEVWEHIKNEYYSLIRMK